MLEADYASIGSAATGFSATGQAGCATPMWRAPSAPSRTPSSGRRPARPACGSRTRLGAAVQVFADDVEAMSQLATATVDSYDHTDTVHASTFRRAAR